MKLLEMAVQDGRLRVEFLVGAWMADRGKLELEIHGLDLKGLEDIIFGISGSGMLPDPYRTCAMEIREFARSVRAAREELILREKYPEIEIEKDWDATGVPGCSFERRLQMMGVRVLLSSPLTRWVDEYYYGMMDYRQESLPDNQSTVCETCPDCGARMILEIGADQYLRIFPD